jgi:hypothetical protein
MHHGLSRRSSCWLPPWLSCGYAGADSTLPRCVLALRPHIDACKAEDIAALRLGCTTSGRAPRSRRNHRTPVAEPAADDLMLRRLKRKLLLKDRIAILERLIEPDESA